MKGLRAILPAAVIVLGPMAMLYPIWTNPVSAGEDDVVYYFPLRKMVGESLRRGRLPLYNPREATGMVLMADPQSAVMYPPTWLFAVLADKLAYSLSVFAAFSLAGGGAYVYLRRLRLMRPAAMFGAAAFMFCGFMVGHRVHLAMIHTACWLPWGLWCIERAGVRPLRAFSWMTAIVFLAIAAGHWPTLVHVGIIWAAYLALRGRPVVRSAAVMGAAILVAVALAWPQVSLTGELLAHTTRQRIGYAVAGENSFFPAAGVLAMFPMLMGSRTPGFFPQQWWGPWHLCEMLGYVGLVTLVLAASAAWRLYRNRPAAPGGDAAPLAEGPTAGQLRGLVRGWVWIGLGAMVFMLGYYLPTYRLIHMLPVLGVMRCPARMVIAVDLAAATLAAISIHLLAGAGAAAPGLEPLSKTIRRGAGIVLPIVMIAVVALVGIAGLALSGVWPDKMPFFAGGAEQMLLAANPSNPAVWVPIAAVVATGLAVRFWLRGPRRRAAVLVVVLLADLFIITRFVDVPPRGAVVPDPEQSPAAAWLRENAPSDAPYRVWGLSGAYHHRPAELLLPKTCASLGFSSIAGYGPFQSPAHAQLLGFRIFGNSRDWPRLLRRNELLSLYNVRYVLAAEPQFRRVIESVRIPSVRPPGQGPNVLTRRWDLKRAELRGGLLRLSTPFLWRRSEARQPVSLRAGEIYRIALDARATDGGAANFLRAELFKPFEDCSWRRGDRLGLTVFPEQIGPRWRHFEWTFLAPRDLGREVAFRVFTMSERPIQVRNISLRRSEWERPVDPEGRLRPGEQVYRKVAELRPRVEGDPPVVIYENRLCRAATPVAKQQAWDSDRLERLKWTERGPDEAPGEAPLLAVPQPSCSPARAAWVSVAAAVILATATAAGLVRRKEHQKSCRNTANS